jgi:transcriptional regulator with XRE-family HTH domain
MPYTTRYAVSLVSALRGLRERRGVSQEVLARRLGVAPSHVSRIESGGADSRLSTFVDIARALQAEVVLVPKEYLSAVRALLNDLQSGQGEAPERPRFA